MEGKCERKNFVITFWSAKIRSVANPSQAPIAHRFMMLSQAAAEKLGRRCAQRRTTHSGLDLLRSEKKLRNCTLSFNSLGPAATACSVSASLVFLESSQSFLYEQIVSLLKLVAGVGGVLPFWATFQSPSGSGDVASRQTLSMSSKSPSASLLRLQRRGCKQPTRSSWIAAAFDRYKADPRGSSSSSIHRVAQSNRGAKSSPRSVDAIAPSTHLFKKLVLCASTAAFRFSRGHPERTADPASLLHVHQASLNRSARENMKRQQLSDTETALFWQTVKAIETQVTDDFFCNQHRHPRRQQEI